MSRCILSPKGFTDPADRLAIALDIKVYKNFFISNFMEVSMARIPYYEVSENDTEKAQLIGSAPKLNVVKVIAHAVTPVLNGFVTLIAALLGQGKLDPALREMAIVRTGLLCGSEYEVHQHLKMSRRLGMPEEKIEALSVGSSSQVFSEVERLVLMFTEEMVMNRKAGAETFAALAKRFSHAEMVELAIVVGCYVMVSMFLMTFEVEIEQKKR
jgi:4-carboxymuconolactone decarboxylase